MATENVIIHIQTRGTARAARGIKRIGVAAQATRKTLALLRNTLVAFAAIRLFSGVITTIAEFGDAMSRIRAITQATAQDFTKLRDRAREMGRTTRFTATEAAQGMLELSKAGFRTAKVLESIDDVLDFATVGQIELSKAAQITAGTLEGFGLEISQVQRVVDTLTAAAHSSLASIEDMGTAMKIVAPFAAKLGVNLEATASIMAILAKRGIKGTLAATSFRRVLANLENPSGTFAKILDDMNIKTERLRPSVVGVTEAFRVLSEAQLGATAAADLFGLRGAVAFSILGDLSDGIEGTADEFGKMEGATKRAAKTIQDTLTNDLLLAKAAFQDLLIAIGDAGFENFARKFTQGLSRGLNFINENLDLVGRGIKTLLVGYALWLTFNGTLVRSLDTVSAALLRMYALLLANPFTAIAVGLTALISALAVFGDAIVVNAKTGKTFGDVWEANAEVLGGVALEALNQFGFNFENFGDIVNSVAKHVGNVFSLMVGVISAGWVALNKIMDLAKLAWVGTTKLMVESMNFFAEAFNATFGKLGAEPLKLIDTTQIDKDLTELTESVLNSFGDIEDAIKEPFRLANALAAARKAAALPPAGSDPRAKLRRPKIKDPEVTGGILPPDRNEINRIKGIADALNDLLAEFFPVIAAAKNFAEANRTIQDAIDEGIPLLKSRAEILKRVERAHLGIASGADVLAEKIEVINDAWSRGIITLKERIKLERDATIGMLEDQTTLGAGISRFFLKRQREAEDAATQIESVLTNAFQGAEDALHEFVTTGKLDFSSLVDSIISDLARMALKMATNSIFQTILGGAGGIGSETGGAGTLQGLFNSVFGGGGGGAAGGIQTAASLFGNTGFSPSFAHGGSFRVGSGSAVTSLPGVDNRLVAFRARDGEDVHVTKKSDSGGSNGGGDTTNITFNVQSDDADSFLLSQSQIQNKLMFGAQTAMRRR